MVAIAAVRRPKQSMRDNMTDDSADSLNDVVTQFTSYEDFLDSKITASALYYLEVRI